MLDLNSKMARDKSMQIKNMIKNFESIYDRLYLSFVVTPTVDIVNQLEAIKREFCNDFSAMLQNKQEMNYL